jgi:diguanylate cyclase (GGDEF)-like protein/PAS domain S-box-containing protein
LSTQFVARLGATLFALSGGVTLLSPLLPTAAPINGAGVAAVGAIAIVIGVAMWFLPWKEWPRSRLLWLIPLSLSLIGVHNYFGGDDPYRYSLFFIIVFMWIGIGQPRWTSLWFAPALAFAYVAPLILSGHDSLIAVSSVAYAVPVCLLVAETLAAVTAMLGTSQHSLEISESKLRSLVEQVPAAIYSRSCEDPHEWLYVSPKIEALTGHSSPTWTGAAWRNAIHEDDRVTLLEDWLVTHATSDSWQREYRLDRPDGSTIWIRDEAAIVRDANGDPLCWQGVLLDITDRRRLEEHVIHQAFHDGLTDLPNRARLFDRIDHALAQRDRGRIALLFLDFDNFKVINDSLGHDAGDAFLIAIANRLTGILRPGDTVARLGGDEFTVLVERLADPVDAVQLAERILTTVSEPIEIERYAFSVSASVGIVVAGTDREWHSNDLLRAADVAMYSAKQKGKNGYALFEPGMEREARQRLAIEQDLRHALERDELRLHYQPLVDLPSGRIYEVEALLRWQHPERGLMPPGDFIQIAEDTGLIVPIGEWVLREASRQVQEWNANVSADEALRLSVNISARQFRQATLVQDVERVLSETGLRPDLLTLEITESLLIENVEATIDILQRIRALGVSIAVDDFGTGYSSLSYLKRFPLDAIKIDRSFVRDLATDAEDQAVVGAVIATSQALRLSVVAEGIESVDQLNELTGLGCGLGQGYYFSRPLTPEAFFAQHREQRQHPVVVLAG